MFENYIDIDAQYHTIVFVACCFSPNLSGPNVWKVLISKILFILRSVELVLLNYYEVTNQSLNEGLISYFSHESVYIS